MKKGRMGGIVVAVGWFMVWVVTAAGNGAPADDERAAPTGSVIFIHPDGASVAHWAAARLLLVGPDESLHWDKLPHMAVYRGHMKDSLAATSHGGGTTHAYGVKVRADSYGMDHDIPLRSLSGAPYSVMREAAAKGLGTGIVNSGNLNEPGTGCFLASVRSRNESEEILAQIIESGTPVIMGGGEMWLLPVDVEGRHGKGARKDGRNLIEEARSNGYAVVFTRDELAALPADTPRVLGVFAHNHTFHDETEETLREKGWPLYAAGAPSLAEMTRRAIEFLSSSGRPFLLVVEEEGVDNFCNKNNAAGAFEALRRADEALGIARAYVAQHPATLLLTVADSDAGGLQVLAASSMDSPLPSVTSNGAPLDGRDGAGSLPFVSAPDRFGRRHPFGVAWTGFEDNHGGILLRAEGLHAETVHGSADNTDVYRLMYLALFGRRLL